jgi:hypothetical protein
MAKKSNAIAAKAPMGDGGEQVVTIDIQPFLLPISIIISSLILAIAMIIASNNIGSGGIKGTNTTTTGVTTTPTTTAEEFPTVTTTIDDDPILGNKDVEIKQS